MSIPPDPERLADATPRSPLADAFASASRELPSDAQLARLAAALGPLLDGAPAAPPARPGVPIAVKWIAGGALALLVGAGLMLQRSAHTASPSPTAAPNVTLPSAAALPAQPPATPASTPLPATDPGASADQGANATAPDPPSAESAKPAPAPAKAVSEAALLEQARRALNGSPGYALQLANQHRARFPNGVLSQEREVIAIEALRRLHRNAEAEQRAAGFSKAFPGSAHQRMVDEGAPK